VADTIPIRLEGGPCDGRNTTARVADFGPTSVTCKGVNYQPTTRMTASRRLIYTPRASQQQPPGPHVRPGTKPSRAHEAWNHMLRTVFVDSPKELRRAEDARQAIRRLRRRHGLR
jgi:hypothetical protein